MEDLKKEEINYLGRLREWIRLNREFDIIDLFSELHPADIADLIDNLEEQEKIRLFSLLEVEKASDVIPELSDLSPGTDPRRHIGQETRRDHRGDGLGRRGRRHRRTE
jgi:magnesium transporter